MVFKKLISKILQAHWSFLILAILFGGILIALTPPLWGADEGAHFFRSYQVSKGELNQQKVVEDNKVHGGYIPESFLQLDELKVEDIKDNASGNPARQVDSFHKYTEIDSKIPAHEKNVANPYSPIIYPFLTYSAPATAMAVINVFHPSTSVLLYVARASTLISYIVIVFIALYMLRNRSAKWLFFIVALLPMSIYDASIVSADPVLLSLTLLFVACVYKIVHMDESPQRWEIVLMTMSAILLTIVKPPYVVLILPLCFIPARSFLSGKERWYVRWIIPSVCVIIAVISILLLGGTAAGNNDAVSGVNAVEQLKWIIHNPLGYFFMIVNSVNMVNWLPQMIGIFGTSFIFIPGPLFQVLLVWLSLSVFITSDKMIPRNEKSQRIGYFYIFSAVIACIAVITVLYLTWTPVGAMTVQGVQGRYFLPMLILSMIGVRVVLKQRLYIEKMWKISVINIGVVGVSLLGTVLFYYKVLY